MSADRLREAANVLRERAEAATEAGFGWRLSDNAGANEVWADRDAAGWDAFMVATTATRLNPNPGTAGHADAAYIATMHPGVGLALADWLTYEAAVLEDEGTTLGDVYPCMALANLILGGAS